MDINFKRLTIADLQSNPVNTGEEFIRIPQFQRKFVWDKEEEVLRLLDDFFDNIDDSYFWGPIILRFKKDHSKYVDIVDGQQRITSFNMLISCIEHILGELISNQKIKPEAGYKLKFKFNDLLVIGEEPKQQVKLKLSKTVNKDFREKLILNNDDEKIKNLGYSPAGQHETFKKIKSSYLKIYNYIMEEFVSEYEGEELKERLGLLFNTLKNKHYFLSIYVEDTEDAFSIFESINAKGKELTTSELVKNLSFQKIYDIQDPDDEHLLDELESQWDEMESQISNFTNFIYHLWVSREGNTKKKKVYKQIKSYLNDASVTETKEFIRITLPDEASIYSNFENAENVDDSTDLGKFRKYHYDTLKSLRASRCYPLLLSLENLLVNDQIEQELFKKFLNTITFLTFWYSSICENDAKKLEKEYHSIARSLRTRNERQNIEEYLDTLNQYFPSQELAKTNFFTKDFTNKTLAKYILRNMEKHLKGDSVYELSDSGFRVNIEHILPLNPSDSSDWSNKFTKIQHTDHKWKIGNLTLLHARKNRKIGNKDFKIKKDVYSESEIEMNKLIAESSDWKPKSITNRNKFLFKKALEIWKYPS